MKDDRLYLIHISEAIARIQQYVAGGEAAFRTSTLIQDAVTRNLQTLAESTKRLSDERKAARRDVDWRRIAGLRNVLVHDYMGVDLDIVWTIITEDLPPLRRAVEEMLGRE